MSFWRGETLLARLPALITPKFDPKNIDSAAYTLTLGRDVFITADLPDVGGAHEGVKKVLQLSEQFRIAPGQFAFLTTQETVEIPNNAIAFISMKATYKLRGLINVSGFHVDPGWKDPLLFSVYNAGPGPVCLTQGMPLFLIWYADLDAATQKTYRGKGKSIDGDLISNMSGQVFSPIALKKEVGRLQDDLREASHNVVRVETAVSTVSKIVLRMGIAVAVLFAGLVSYLYKEVMDSRVEIARLQGKFSEFDSRANSSPTQRSDTEKKAPVENRGPVGKNQEPKNIKK